MRDALLTNMERITALGEAEQTFQMNEETFRLFYDRTARPLWLYLARMTRDDRLADDLLQETYYRLLRTRATFDDDEHRKNYLFRIATNLVRDHRRHVRTTDGAAGRAAAEHRPADADDAAARRIDLDRALDRLKPRERSVLWLAYAQGWSHEEIAASLGVKTASMKALLHRARRRLAALLRAPHRTGGRP
jgi:RNA polymerase sigma-70 factor (ECF subfamily)